MEAETWKDVGFSQRSRRMKSLMNRQKKKTTQKSKTTVTNKKSTVSKKSKNSSRQKFIASV